MIELEIRRLNAGDAQALNRLLTSDGPDYSQHFAPFDLEPSAIAIMLRTAARDCFWGILAAGELVALVMLRGLDAGHRAPAFGVYIARDRARRGLGTLALRFAEAWCRLNSCEELMLTVHPANEPARRIYERAGFAHSGEQSPRGDWIYRKVLD